MKCLLVARFLNKKLHLISYKVPSTPQSVLTTKLKIHHSDDSHLSTADLKKAKIR